MNRHVSHSRRSLLGGVVAAAASAAAPGLRAQPLLKGPATGALSARAARVTGVSNVRVARAQGSVVSAPDNPIAPVAALTHFQFGYHNGDHKFRRLQVLVEGKNARVAFNDQNDDDPFEAIARWVNFSAGQSGGVSASGHGRAVTQIAIPPGPPRHVFALRGFEFRRKDGTDANVRHLAIRFTGTAVEALLSDDEGMDLRLGGDINPLDPLHSFIAAQLRRSGQRGRPYDVTVQYVWIPDVLVAGTGTITGSERRQRDAARVPSPGESVIRGFSFSFLNSDHHLLHVLATTANGGLGRFRDNNEDDPVRWSIEYAHLRS